MVDYTAYYETPMGGMTMASDGEGLTGLWFEGQRFYGATLMQEHEVREELPVFDLTRRWLEVYFEGRCPDFTPPLTLRGSDFRLQVWQQLLQVPYGSTTTYGELARRLVKESGTRVSAQAVGGAVGHNPIALIVPCHRVVGSDGSLTGYAGGLERKKGLLALERQGIAKE